MHELSTMINFVNSASSIAERNGASSIVKLTVDVGEMTGILPEYLYHYFPKASKGTPCEGAELFVNFIPVEIECSSCKKHYHPEEANDRSCPECRSTMGKIIRGRELSTAEIIVNDEVL